VTFSLKTLSITTLCHCAECRYPECCVLFIVMLNVVMLSVIVLSVVAPFGCVLKVVLFTAIKKFYSMFQCSINYSNPAFRLHKKLSLFFDIFKHFKIFKQFTSKF
jgi:hypothetical protein